MKEIWKQSAFRWYWLGLFLSGVGDQFGWLGLTWFVMHKTGSSTAMGTTVLVYLLPGVFSSLIVGVLLDRFDRRKLIIIDNLLRGLLFFLLVSVLYLDQVPLSIVYVLVALAGMLSPISSFGAQTLLPRLVTDKALLVKANGLMESQWQLIYLFGPAVAGVMISLYGEANVLIFDAVSFFVCAFCFARVKLGATVPESTTEPREPIRVAAFLRSLLTDLKTGYLYLWKRPLILWLIFFTFLFNMAYGPIEVALPIYAEKELVSGAVSLGLLWSALAIGALLGSLVFSAVSWKVPTGYSLASIIVLWGITTLPLAFSGRFEVAMVSMAMAGFSFAPYNIMYRSYLQKSVPEELLGRVLTSVRTITGLGLPLGAFASGVLIPHLEVSGLFAAAAVVCIAVGLLALRVLRRLD